MSLDEIGLAAAAGILACLPLGQMIAAERSISAMASAADGFLAALTPEQRQQATFPLESDERMRWHYIPNEMFPRNGIAAAGDDAAAAERAHGPAEVRPQPARLRHGDRNHRTSRTSCSELEKVGRFARDPVDYQFTVFGTPARRTPGAGA